MNGTPYHNADNGFACAAAGRGITEALQEHLNVIIRNEELEIEISDSQIQAKINDLAEDKERLEQQKLDRQESLSTLTEELAEMEMELSELNAELENPLNADATSPSPRIDELKKEIEENFSELGEKQVAQAKLETDLEAPTEVELNADSGVAQGSSKQRLSSREKILLGVPLTLVVLGLIGYLIIFYASAGDRAFTKGIGTNEDREQIIIPQAFFKAWEAEGADGWVEKNWFVITFPFIFLTLAFLVHFCYEDKNRSMFRIIIGGTLLIDLIIAIKISRQIHEVKDEVEMVNSVQVPVSYWNLDTPIEILSVLLLGFGASLLLGFGLLWVIKIWRGDKPYQDESEKLEQLKRSEQNDRLVELNALTTEVQQLESKINILEEELANYTNHVEDTAKHQILVKIARLNTKKESQQSQFDQLNEQVDAFQMEINQCETEIGSSRKRQRQKSVDLKKLEANAYEFVTGWCKYVAQSKNQLPADVTNQIEDVQSLANDTLEAYKATLHIT